MMVVLALSGCASAGIAGNPGVAGPGGSQPEALIAALGNGLIAPDLSLSAGDRSKALQAEYRALEYAQGGEQIAWTGSRAGAGGEVVAGQPYQVGSQNCRQYSHSIRAKGKQATTRGTACRKGDGSWTPIA